MCTDGQSINKSTIGREQIFLQVWPDIGFTMVPIVPTVKELRV